MKKIYKLGLVFFTSILSLSCSPWSIGSLNFRALALTRIDTDKITTQARIKWEPVSGTEYFELSRIESGEVTILGSSKISKDILSFVDKDIKMNSTYKYRIYALDINNKPISKGETDEIKTFSSDSIQEVQLSNYNLLEKNKVSREEKMKWNPVSNADFYYSFIKNSKDNKPIFGLFSKDPMAELNTYVAPVNLDAILTTDVPTIIQNGLDINTDYKFSVYSVRTNSKEQNKINSVVMKQSKEITIGL